MRTTTLLAATVLLLTTPVSPRDAATHTEPQVLPRTDDQQARESSDRSIRDLHEKVDKLAAQLAAVQTQLEQCLKRGAQGGTAPSQPGANAGSLYNAAYDAYLKGDYDAALREFQEYVASFPKSELTDNAYYWMGETYYRQRRYGQAIEQFDVVLKRSPASDKAAPAILKKGYSHLELGQRSQGVAQLRQVILKYPATDEARFARERLREIGVR
jgi:tol-pal system protein YbgF